MHCAVCGKEESNVIHNIHVIGHHLYAPVGVAPIEYEYCNVELAIVHGEVINCELLKHSEGPHHEGIFWYEGTGLDDIRNVPEPEGAYSDLTQELTQLLTRHSAENASGTPSFILANLLITTLKAFDTAVVTRENWHEG